jgi:hypothetical protein
VYDSKRGVVQDGSQHFHWKNEEKVMTHGPLRLPLSELLDRLSIELRKQFYGHGNDALIDDIKQELHGRLANIHDEPRSDLGTNKIMAVLLGSMLLGIRNADIANLEWQLRAGQHLSLEEHGRRALAIRKINDGRNQAKADLSKVLGENVETKHYGYGDSFKYDDFTMDVQEVTPHKCSVAFRIKTDSEQGLVFCTLNDGHKGEHKFAQS